MGSPNSLHFNDYVFGEQDDNADSYQQSVSPMSNSSQLSSTSLSPLQNIMSQQQNKSNKPRLTKDMLEKKDLIDILLEPSATRRKITRRRSISNGNLSRRLYNDDNKPMRIIHPYKRGHSDDSDVSVHSPTSQQDRHSHHILFQQTKLHHRNNRRLSSAHIKKSTPSKDSNRDRSYGSITNKKQSTNSRSVNTSRASSSIKDPWNHPLTAEESSRRFSGIVRLSVAHIALQRSKKSKKRHYHSTFYSFFYKLVKIASRVMDCRTSEPRETRMTVEELVSLSQYIDKLKSGFDHNSSSSSSDSFHSDTISDRKNTGPTIELFVDEPEDSTEEIILPTYNTFEDESPVMKKSRHISSLGNIFPFTPIHRVQSSASEASETDRLLPPHPFKKPHIQLQESPWINRVYARFKYNCVKLLSRCIKFVRHQLRHPFHKQSYEDINTLIRFEGWSLFFFSPTCSLRFHLWKIIGSK